MTREDGVNRDMVKGLALGVGVGLLAPVVFPALGRVARPGMNAAIRAGVLAWERGRETLAELGEYAEDMVAEARAGRTPPAADAAREEAVGG